MSHTTTKKTSLLAYVIAYLQEEQKRRWKAAPFKNEGFIRSMVEDAIDAYEGGAR